VPATPDHFYGEPTDSEGEVILRWKRTVRRCIFQVQWHTDPPDADHWHFELSCTQQKMSRERPGERREILVPRPRRQRPRPKRLEPDGTGQGEVSRRCGA